MANLDGRSSVVVIDDDEELLTKLTQALERELSADSVDIRAWMPDEGQNPLDEFQRRVDDDTVLVVTDYDLTRKGLTGLFGVSIVGWCQARLVPVVDFSRANISTLPREPALFELRIPPGVGEAAYTARMFRGFQQLRSALASGAVDLTIARSPAEVLGTLLERPQQESHFALYMSLLGAANASLLGNFRTAPAQEEAVSHLEKEHLLAYVLGHVLANAILRYPGPILSEMALCAYMGTTEEEASAVGGVFEEARYRGPFSAGATYYWRADIDRLIDRASPPVGDTAFETSGELNRAVVENILGRPLALHECTRCQGRNGGYLCPFTRRPVCERADCSVAANSWIPAGADLSRIERDFYEEWAPLLGL